jgi:hypothetical protein
VLRSGWRYVIVVVDGFGSDATPWRAVQRAAWGALKKYSV